MRHLILLIAISFWSCGQSNSKEKSGTSSEDTIKTQVESQLQDNEASAKDSIVPGETPDARQVNTMLRTRQNGEWHLVTDKEADWQERELTEYGITAGRKKDPNYPFIVKGDFNGDGLTDYAVVATDDKREYDRLKTRIIVLLAGTDPVFINDYSTVHSMLSLVPRNSYIKGEGTKRMVVNHDAIEVNNHDTGGYNIYWDGAVFKTLSMLD